MCKYLEYVRELYDQAHKGRHQTTYADSACAYAVDIMSIVEISCIDAQIDPLKCLIGCMFLSLVMLDDWSDSVKNYCVRMCIQIKEFKKVTMWILQTINYKLPINVSFNAMLLFKENNVDLNASSMVEPAHICPPTVPFDMEEVRVPPARRLTC